MFDWYFVICHGNCWKWVLTIVGAFKIISAEVKEKIKILAYLPCPRTQNIFLWRQILVLILLFLDYWSYLLQYLTFKINKNKNKICPVAKNCKEGIVKIKSNQLINNQRRFYYFWLASRKKLVSWNITSCISSIKRNLYSFGQGTDWIRGSHFTAFT